MLHPNSIFSWFQFDLISITICFSKPKNKFNRLSFTRNMQCTFHRTAVTFALGAYFQSLGLSQFPTVDIRRTCLLFIYFSTKQGHLKQLYLSPLSLTGIKFKISLVLGSTFCLGKICACLNRGNVAETTFWHKLIMQNLLEMDVKSHEA